MVKFSHSVNVAALNTVNMERQKISKVFTLAHNNHHEVQKFELNFKTQNKNQAQENNNNLYTEETQKCNFHYFHYYLKTGFYLCVIPFYPSYDEQNGHYRLKTNLLQKVSINQSILTIQKIA